MNRTRVINFLPSLIGVPQRASLVSVWQRNVFYKWHFVGDENHFNKHQVKIIKLIQIYFWKIDISDRLRFLYNCLIAFHYI